jgi:hypothetical protein
MPSTRQRSPRSEELVPVELVLLAAGGALRRQTDRKVVNEGVGPVEDRNNPLLLLLRRDRGS